MKKQSLFSKAMMSKKDDPKNELNQAFPVAMKLNKEDFIINPCIKVETGQILLPSTMESKANFHNLSEKEYEKINEENTKLIQSMDQSKIEELQQQLREQLGSGLVDMFKSGTMYNNKNNDFTDKEIQVTQQFQKEVDENIKNNYQSLQSFFSDYMQQNDCFNIGALRFTLTQQYQNFEDSSITLDQLFKLFCNIKSKGDLQEIFEILNVVIDTLLTQFKKKDYIEQFGKTIYRVEVVQYFERNLKLSQFLLQNLTQLFTDLKHYVIYTLEKWMSLIVYDPWCFSYTGLDQKNNKLQTDIIETNSLQEKLQFYQQLLSQNNVIQILRSVLKDVNLWTGEQRFYSKVLDLLREFSILCHGLEIQSIMNILSPFYLNSPKIRFIEMIKLIIFGIDHIEFAKKQIEIDFTLPETYQMIYWYGKMMDKQEFNALTNILIQTISLTLKSQVLIPEYAQSVSILFLIYDKIFNQNISSLFQVTFIRSQEFSHKYFGEYFFLQQQEDQIQFFAIYFQQILQDLEYQQLEDQQPHNQLAHLSKILFNLKLNGLSVVSRAIRKQYKSYLFGQVREMFREFLFRLTKIRLNAHSQNNKQNLDLIHVFTQITCRTLGIVFYKQNQTEEVSFEVDAPSQGYLNTLYVKKMILLNDTHQDQALKYMERFFDQIDDYKQYIHPEHLLVRYMKFLILDENLYLKIDQTIQIKFLNFIVQLLDWDMIGQVLNKNVQFFEKLLLKYTYDSFKQPIFSNVLFIFTNPIFKGDIHNLILQEFAANADLLNLQINMIDQFKLPPAYALKSQISLESYKRHVRQIQNYQLDNKLVQEWIQCVLEW